MQVMCGMCDDVHGLRVHLGYKMACISCQQGQTPGNAEAAVVLTLIGAMMYTSHRLHGACRECASRTRTENQPWNKPTAIIPAPLVPSTTVRQ
mmetsp:Transcript_57309/g.134358  ORF Transcript_57309/g.134358 Transcript_57309/m.134358 type:complete len:93 (-) Transcript_57309:316-594(-)